MVSIIAILASVAVPTYRRYLIRSQRSEAKIALLQLQTAQEKFYMQNNSFTDNITDGVAGWSGSPSDHRDGQVHDRGGARLTDGQTYDGHRHPARRRRPDGRRGLREFHHQPARHQGRVRAERCAGLLALIVQSISMMRGLRAALFFRDPAQRVRHSARMPIRFRAMRRTHLARRRPGRSSLERGGPREPVPRVETRHLESRVVHDNRKRCGH